MSAQETWNETYSPALWMLHLVWYTASRVMSALKDNPSLGQTLRHSANPFSCETSKDRVMLQRELLIYANQDLYLIVLVVDQRVETFLNYFIQLDFLCDHAFG